MTRREKIENAIFALLIIVVLPALIILAQRIAN